MNHCIRYNLRGVANQFQLEGGKRACVPICILTLFHLYRRMCQTDFTKQWLLTVDEWTVLLEKGIDLYDLWVERHVNNTVTYYDQSATLFPLIEEVLALDECESFTKLFKIGITERTGLVRKSSSFVEIDNVEGTLLTLLVHVASESRLHKRPVCALIILPGRACVAVIHHIESFYFFDSHPDDDGYCEFTQFFHAKELGRHLINKYKIDALSEIEPEYLNYCTEEEIQSNYGYHAKIFI